MLLPVPATNTIAKRPDDADAMNVGGKNSQMHESLLAGGDDRQHMDGIIARMREAGCAESTLELMRNPQPLP